jgi:hypothetical protein
VTGPAAADPGSRPYDGRADWPGALKACLERAGKRSKLIENEPQFEATRQKIAQLHALLLEMKRQVPHSQYVDMAQAFLTDIQQMEAEMREYLLSTTSLESAAS